MVRVVVRSNEFDEFYYSLPENVQTKLDYALNILREVKVVNTKLAKKLVNTDFLSCAYLLAMSIE